MQVFENGKLDYSGIETYWCAIYENGESLIQFEADGSENKYGDIDKASLRRFVIFRNEIAAVVIHLDPAKKLIYRMRRAQDNHGNEETVFLVGWQEKRNGMNIQMLVFLFGDGHTEIVDRFFNDHPWFYGIQFLEDEKI